MIDDSADRCQQVVPGPIPGRPVPRPHRTQCALTITMGIAAAGPCGAAQLEALSHCVKVRVNLKRTAMEYAAPLASQPAMAAPRPLLKKRPPPALAPSLVTVIATQQV